MLHLFKRAASADAADVARLGASLVAMPLPPGAAVPSGASAVVVDPGGNARRVFARGRIKAEPGVTVFCFHPGPYTVSLVPFAAAPELGLQVSFAVDSADPRLSQQRFDLYLASECDGKLELAALARSMELALQRELAQGNVELPPCASLDEWNAFRAGFNQLLYTRFGVSVDDCIPTDLAPERDYGQILLGRAKAPAAPALAAPGRQQGRFDAAATDALAMRRLFLELPSLMAGWRVAALSGAGAQFGQCQALLQRLDLAGLAASTMPALELAAPGQPLAPDQQVRRARHSALAAAALDEAWALLARASRADRQPPGALLDDLERIVANLESHCAGRRTVSQPGDTP
jgi:hypothetical protein